MSAEVAVLAPMAAEGAVDTRQAPARTETVRGKEKGAKGRQRCQVPQVSRWKSVILVSLSGG